MRVFKSLTLLAALAAVVVAAPAMGASATVTRAWQFKDASAAGLELENLIGDVRVEAGSAAGFHVSVQVTTEGDTSFDAESLANAVEFRTRDAGGASLFQVRFPEDRFDVIYWPGAPRGLFGGRVYVKYLGERRRLTGDPDEGAHVRVDIVVRMPEGAHLKARSRFGDLLADRVSGDLTLDGGNSIVSMGIVSDGNRSSRGLVRSANGKGRVVLDSGSGRVEVDGHEGEVVADTGSGAVVITGCRCQINADTGSGSVKVETSSGELKADTGSGSVKVRDFAGSVHVDTGSGGVEIVGLRSATELMADTGSGSVRVSGDLSGLDRLHIDTASGGVTLEASAWPSMSITIDTGSGHVATDVPGSEVIETKGGMHIVRIGNGAGSGLVDTGSGSVRLRTVTAATE